MSYDLSILIPARNEMFLARTIQDILENIEGNTEVIAVLDGQLADPPITQDPRVTVIYLSESIGQRAATNMACKLSKAKYVMKVDAHCAFDKGFDVKMMEDMQDDWTMVPVMRNLHAFDWVCPDGHRRYQGPSGVCNDCGKETERDVVWIAKPSPQSTSYRFDRTLHFQYNGEYTKGLGYKAGLIKGYKLSFDTTLIPTSIIGALANFAYSHSLTCSQNCLWWRQNMTPDAVGLSPIDNGRGIRAQEISLVRDELQVERVATSSVAADMIDNGDVLTPATRDGAYKPSEGNSVCECLVLEESTPTITPSVDSSNPIPTASSTINSDVIDELNSIIGGDFIYSEKTSSFHNNSVSLTLVRDKELSYTLSLQGSCFMLTREKYWELDICDEAHGSWGQQGVEVACKTWLSGGRVVVNHKTWYAHMFRTQGGDFSFPYPQKESDVEKARQYSRDLFLNDKWDKAIHPLSWLVEKFGPVPDWHEGNPTKEIIYYTDNQLNVKLAKRCQSRLKQTGMGIISVSLKPMTFGKNIHLPLRRSYLTMFKQILAGLEASKADVVFFAEHDVLYDPTHFEFIPPEKDVIYYNTNVWKVRSDGHAVRVDDCRQTSGLCAYRETLIKHYKERVKRVEAEGFTRRMGFEPGTHNRKERVDDLTSETWESEKPNFDIRHEGNLTSTRWRKDQFRNQKFTEGWRESTLELLTDNT